MTKEYPLKQADNPLSPIGRSNSLLQMVPGRRGARLRLTGSLETCWRAQSLATDCFPWTSYQAMAEFPEETAIAQQSMSLEG